LIDGWAAAAVAVGLIGIAAAVIVRRRARSVGVIATSALLACLLLGAAPASAGGGTTLRIGEIDGPGGRASRWTPWAAPGAVVTLRATFWIEPTQAERATAWVATLRGVREEHEIRLAPVVIHDVGSEILATATITVPPVDTGMYTVGVCDARTCSRTIADMSAADIIVADSQAEALLVLDAEDMRYRIDDLVSRRDRLERDLEALGERLRTVGALRAEAEREATDLRTAFQQASARADAAQAATERMSDALLRWRTFGVAAAVGAIVSLTLWLTGAHRRSSEMPTVPEPAEELVGSTAGR